MCEQPILMNGGGGGGGGGSKGAKGAKVVGVIAGASVLVYACTPDPAKAPVAQAAPASSGIPWLTISLTALTTLAVATLVYAVVRRIRRRRRVAVAMPLIAPPRVQRQRAIEGPRPPKAQAWLDGKVDAR